ncbi:DHH family phosphoesterase [Desulfobulbus alkaliphilus]|uniref:DHH family phosphoesterase n=1 Tax=Desulfobulbus alkaliphilus TaxID=869814 RepID=UPI00196520E0|nr:bifunctional oligoribonuclease/PAP phosphatase NrnA [Desulfobulbus alkaliphilus]MBM9535626.1 bifunctional oligoribonuclease/PAP phosphatase NrnA [Desulfobulbus alkaliphilus]
MDETIKEVPADSEAQVQQTQQVQQPARLDLAEQLASRRGEKHVVVLQDFPDPDAIACGFAHQIISRAFEIQTTLVHGGRISHQQNIALVKLLGIELMQYDTSLDLTQFAGAVFLDNQGTTVGTIIDDLEKSKVPSLIVIDHHEPQGRLEPLFKDIRPKIGSTSSIYAQYLQNGIIEMKPSDKTHTLMATALTHGIITDTNGFVYARDEDFQAAAFLSRYRDADILAQIMNQARSKQTMKVIHKALGSRKIIESFSLSGVGYLRADDRDAIPQAADFLLTEENVHTAIVFGIVTGENWEEAIVGSMRTNRITIDPDQFIKEVFGKDASGHYFGGGKMSAGGFHVPMGFLAGGEGGDYQERKWNLFDEKITQKVCAKIGAKHGKDDSKT